MPHCSSLALGETVKVESWGFIASHALSVSAFVRACRAPMSSYASLVVRKCREVGHVAMLAFAVVRHPAELPSSPADWEVIRSRGTELYTHARVSGQALHFWMACCR